MKAFCIWMKRFSLYALIVFLCAVPSRVWGEAGKMSVQIQDAYERPIADVEIGIKGIGDSKVSGSDGKVQLALGKDTNENDYVILQIVHSPRGKDLVIISPWDARTQVPSFKEKAENFVLVVLVQRGDRAALTNPKVTRGLAAQINQANSPKATGGPLQLEDAKANRDAVAKQYGFAPEDVDTAIRSWGSKASDPYDVGLAALYERDYPKATTQLRESLREREKQKLAADKAVADAAFFLGTSLYGEGKYSEAAIAYQRCLEIRKNDIRALHSATTSLRNAGDNAAAEKLGREGLAIAEKELSPDSPELADTLTALAVVLQDKGDNMSEVQALLLYRRAMNIYVKVYGPGHPDEATIVNNECLLLYDRHLYSEAELSCRSALAVNEKAPGHEQSVAANLNNLGMVLVAQGKYAEAEPLYQRALGIREKGLGHNHPEVATVLSNLGLALYYQDRYKEAEPLYRRALAIDQEKLGPNHANVANDLNNLGLLLRAKGDYKSAEELYQRALAIAEKSMGPDHPGTKQIRKNLEELNANKPKEKE
jgi:tetratricopeptide (TPR) repeat protein